MSLHRPEGGALRDRTLRSVFWILAYNVLRAVVYFLAPATIAWLTGPLELGLAQLAFGVWQVTLPVITLGTKAAVLQREDPTQSYLSSVFWVNMLMGALLARRLEFRALSLANIVGGAAAGGGPGSPRRSWAAAWGW